MIQETCQCQAYVPASHPHVTLVSHVSCTCCGRHRSFTNSKASQTRYYGHAMAGLAHAHAFCSLTVERSTQPKIAPLTCKCATQNTHPVFQNPVEKERA